MSKNIELQKNIVEVVLAKSMGQGARRNDLKNNEFIASRSMPHAPCSLHHQIDKELILC
jgi:hypothetical protein